MGRIHFSVCCQLNNHRCYSKNRLIVLEHMTMAAGKLNFFYPMVAKSRFPPVEAVRVMNAIALSICKEFNTIFTNKEGIRAIILFPR